MWVFVYYTYLFLQFASVTREWAGIYCFRFISQDIFHQVNRSSTSQVGFVLANCAFPSIAKFTVFITKYQDILVYSQGYLEIVLIVCTF